MKKQETIEDAKTYLENAKSILKEKAQLEGGYYSKPKYVKMAGNTAWNGVLVALDVLMHEKGINKKGRKNVDDYRDLIARENLKLLKTFNSAYNHLHLFMGYDGELNAQIAKTGMKLAEEIIHWVEKKIKK
ncbi:MAG: hypothetical protein KatS3mg027_1765 [Bacteroidia bacterium]|nr:MAG: hypothetical protein KatS3mg027_1765 [Bacteroidia bacterium]